MSKEALQLLLGYLLLMNLIAFVLMGLDKRRARRDKWRISEKTLFLPAVLGGSLGAILGMRLFHHKTKHWYSGTACPPFWRSRSSWEFFWGGGFYFGKSTNWRPVSLAFLVISAIL